MKFTVVSFVINHLKAELNPICHLLALLGAHHILRVSRIRVKPCASTAVQFLDVLQILNLNPFSFNYMSSLAWYSIKSIQPNYN